MTVNGNITEKAIQHYGKDMQSIVCMEECAELQQAISKELRGKSNKDNLAEEIADVLICIYMLKEMYGISDYIIQNWINVKQKRMEERIMQDAKDKQEQDWRNAVMRTFLGGR